ncbi:MAG: hypothetical protein GX093_11615 [Xanthomonadaceae bacterium]|nr:hypothetical protein [Xanthomonadaceae bacterium]
MGSKTDAAAGGRRDAPARRARQGRQQGADRRGQQVLRRLFRIRLRHRDDGSAFFERYEE